MVLADRYLYAVKRHLPRAQRKDILAELAETLDTQLADEASLLGRPLTDDEAAVILARYGEPRVVAARYAKPRYLIGPALYRPWVFSVTATLVVLVPFILMAIGFALSNDADEPLPARLGSALMQWGFIALANVALVTAIFAIIERRARHDDDQPWDPHTLPHSPGTPQPVTRAESLGSFFWLVMLLLWWQGINSVLWRWFGWEPSPFAAAPVWDRVTPLVLLFIGAGMARDAVVLWRPLAIRFHAAVGLLLDLLALTVVFTLLGAGEWVTVANPNDPTALFVRTLNGSVAILLLVLAVVFVVSAAFDTRRLRAVARAGTV